MFDHEFLALLRPHLRYLDADADLPGDASLRDLGLDSMASVALMLDLEDHFGCTVPDRLLTPEAFASPASLWETFVNASSGRLPDRNT